MGLTSEIFLPEHNHCPRTRVKCGVEKLNWATGQTITPSGLERVFKRSTQTVDSPLAAKMSKSSPRVPWGNMQHRSCMFGKKMLSKKLPYAGRNFPASAEGFPWRINCPPGPKDSHLLRACWTADVKKLSVNCSSPVLPQWPVQGSLSFNPSGRS